MSYESAESTAKHTHTILEYVEGAEGLKMNAGPDGSLEIFQEVDGKAITITKETIEDVISRVDSNGSKFLQVNFDDGRKILITDRLIGFKPIGSKGLDLKKLPKVVTTPDLVSVVEAIEESMSAGFENKDEVELLRKVFDSVLAGGEAVGFDLTREKAWVSCIVTPSSPASA